MNWIYFLEVLMILKTYFKGNKMIYLGNDTYELSDGTKISLEKLNFILEELFYDSTDEELHRIIENIEIFNKKLKKEIDKSYKNGYENGYDDGYSEGYDTGYIEGKLDCE